MEVVFACLQRLYQDRSVAIIVVDNGVEIETPRVVRELSPPIIRDSPVGDRAARIDLGDAVGAAAKRRLHRRLAEGVHLVIGLGDDGQPAHDQRQLAVVGIGEMEGDVVLAGGLDPVDAGKLVGKRGMALGREDFERERHIAGRDRRAVVPASPRPEEEAHAAPVGRERDTFGDEPVGRVRLVRRAFEQAFEGQTRARRAHALQRERIERAEGIDRGEVQHAPPSVRSARHIRSVQNRGRTSGLRRARARGLPLALSRARSRAGMAPSTTRRRWRRPERSVFY